MIGRLRGHIIYKQPPELMLEVSGVGYELLASMVTFSELPEINEETTLFTHFVVREDAQTLYAFSSISERRLFRILLKVNGVGPKMALAIVSGMTANEFIHFVREGNTLALTRLPGVGKKTAERLIIEMRDQVKKFPTDDKPDHESSVHSEAATIHPINIEEEALNALLALGYKPTQANHMVSTAIATHQNETNVEVIIRHALKASLK